MGPSVRLPLLAAQTQTAYFPPQLSSSFTFPITTQAPGADLSVRLPLQTTQELLPPNSLPQARS